MLLVDTRGNVAVVRTEAVGAEGNVLELSLQVRGSYSVYDTIDDQMSARKMEVGVGADVGPGQVAGLDILIDVNEAAPVGASVNFGTGLNSQYVLPFEEHTMLVDQSTYVGEPVSIPEGIDAAIDLVTEQASELISALKELFRF